MTACYHFSGSLYINRKPCEAGVDNFDKLDDLPCCVYGQGDCNKHTVGKPKVEASKMPGYEPGFDEFNAEPECT